MMMKIQLLPIQLLLFLHGSQGLQCFQKCEDQTLETFGLCPITCDPDHNACLSIFSDSGGAVTLIQFGCINLASESCQNTRCNPQQSGIGTHQCCCNDDLCNIIPGFGPIPPSPPTPAGPPPIPMEDQLACESYRTEDTLVFHDYEENCPGHCTAAFRTDERSNYVLHELGCSNELIIGPTNCTLNTSGTDEEVSCGCTGHLCNRVAELQFTDITSVVHPVDRACDELGCSQICVNPGRDDDPPRCLCRPGFIPSTLDSTICLDKNECDAAANGCSHECLNTEGSFQCTCPPLLLLGEDGQTCYEREGLICDMNTSTIAETVVCKGLHPRCQAFYTPSLTGELVFVLSGCLTEGDGVGETPSEPSSCILQLDPNISPRLYTCACSTSLCTRNLDIFAFITSTSDTTLAITDEATTLPLTLTPSEDITLEAGTFTSSHVIGLVVAFTIVAVCVVLVVVSLAIWCYFKKRNKAGRGDQFLSIESRDEPSFCHAVLNPSSVSIPANFFAKGRYGHLHKGTNVDPNYPIDLAVKVFNDSCKESWLKECEIYSRFPNSNENILKFYCKQDKPQMWIITEYYPMGDLSSVLNRIMFLTWEQTYSLVLCVVKGLTFLHYDDSDGKPPIAHRDIKPSNILVRDGYFNCCISDLGLAVTLPLDSQCDLVGTPRYMPPEVILGSISIDDILTGDTYALSMTMWEMLCKTRPDHIRSDHVDLISQGGSVLPHMTPYAEFLGESSPTLQVMRDFFEVDDNDTKRPTIPEDFLSHQKYSIFVTCIKETWSVNPKNRVTVASVLTRLSPPDDSGNDSMAVQQATPNSPQLQKQETTL